MGQALPTSSATCNAHMTMYYSITFVTGAHSQGKCPPPILLTPLPGDCCRLHTAQGRGHLRWWGALRPACCNGLEAVAQDGHLWQTGNAAGHKAVCQRGWAVRQVDDRGPLNAGSPAARCVQYLLSTNSPVVLALTGSQARWSVMAVTASHIGPCV